MTRGRIGIPATPKTELPMTISNCFFPIDIITKRSIPDPKFPSGDSNAKQSRRHTVGLRSTSGKSLSRSLICIIDSGFEVSCILIFTVPFDT